jgi:hypothetical protein
MSVLLLQSTAGNCDAFRDRAVARFNATGGVGAACFFAGERDFARRRFKDESNRGLKVGSRTISGRHGGCQFWEQAFWRDAGPTGGSMTPSSSLVSRIVAVVCIVSAGGWSLEGVQSLPDRVSAVEAFSARVNSYVGLHRRLEAPLDEAGSPCIPMCRGRFSQARSDGLV